MAAIRPDEVSSVIKEQLAGVKTAAQLEEVGTVLQVGDGIARIYGLTQGDVRRISEVTKLPLQQCLIWLEFEKEKNKLEADAIKKAYKS